MSFLTLTNVSKMFVNTFAVKDFNLEVEKGELVSFLGPFRLRQNDHTTDGRRF